MKFYLRGLGASFPLVLGYFPVAIAFGLAAKGAGFSAMGAGLISAFIFAGASQFAFIGMISGGTSIVLASMVCLALNLRHIVYGPGLSLKLKGMDKKFLPIISYGLTDEVFSTAISKLDRIKGKDQAPWILGLETGAYFTWVFASYIGGFSGEIILGFLPFLKPALSFALPALFLTLLVLMVDGKTIIPVIVSAFAAWLLICLGYSSYSMPGAALTGPLTFYILRRGAWV